MMTNLLFNRLTAIGKRFAMVLTMLVVVGIGNVWGEEIYSNTGASGTTNYITASGNVNNNNGNPKPSFGGTSEKNKTITFTGFDLSSYTSIQFALDAAWTSFPSTTQTWPHVTFTTYLDDNVVYTNSTTITWSNKTTSYSTYTFSDLQQFDKVVLTISPAEGKSKSGNATTIYSCYIDNISITAEEGATQPSYSVTYEADGGETTCEDNTKYEEGADVMLCDEIPTKENYVFNGWSSDPSVTVTDGKFKMPKSDVTFTAQWSECTGPLITAFNTNGKTDGTYNLGAELGTLSVTAEPSNGGNLIYRWYQYDDATTKDQAKLAAGTNNEATYQIPNNEPCIARHYYCIVSEEGCDKKQESAISGALTLNAIQHTITWSVNGTTQSLSPSSVTDGNNLGTLPTPNLDGICEGKTFVGWTTEANKNYSHETTAPLLITEDTKPNGDVTYYAVFATQEDGAKKTIIFADEWDTNQDLSEHSYFDNAITLSFAKNEGTTAPQYYTSSAAIRLYYDNTMTVTTTTIMQSITFTFVTEDAKGNSISTNPDFGTLLKTPSPQSTESLTHTWNVNTTSVTFTIGKDQNNSASGHCKISQIDVVTGDGNAVTYSNYTTSCSTTYTIDYVLDGGTGGCEDARVEEGGNHTICNDIPTRTGYTFQGWKYNDTETIYTEHTFTDIQADITLVAQWNPITYSVVFDANEGTGTMDSQTFTYDVAQQLTPNTFIRDSYIFAGWATTADGDVVYTDAQSVSNLTTTNGATVTLYAQWSELYTVTFYNMGSVYTTKTQESVGGSITIQETPSACEGYTFDGWSATEVDGVTSYEAVTTITPNEDTQLYAVYSKTEDGGGIPEESVATISYTDSKLSFSGTGWSTNIQKGYSGNYLRLDDDFQYVYFVATNGTVSQIKFTYKLQPSTNCSGHNQTSWWIGEIEFYASTDNGNSWSKIDSKSISIDSGDNLNKDISVTYSDLSSGGYNAIKIQFAKDCGNLAIKGLSTISGGGPSTTYTTSPDCAEVYNITIDPNIEHGSVTASPMSAVAGTTISLTATPDDTYKFDSWQVTDENSNTIDVTTENTFIMPETDVTVSAIFTEKKRYTITWYANGSEYTTTDVIEDIQIAPPALPNMENYCGVFAGWTTESPVSGNFDETPTLYNEQSEFPLATEETPKTFYAVFADVEGVIPEMPTVIAYWENQELTKDEGVSAKIGTGTMTSNIALSTEYPRTHSNSNISSTYPTLTLSNLNLSSHTNVSLLFWARASQEGDITIKSNLSNEAIATINTTKEEKLYVINNIPSSATSITLTYGENSGSFYFGSVKLYSAATYSFEKLTAENTNGWSGNDWNGYYLITNDQNSLRALDGNGINEDCHFSVIDNDGIIEYSIASAFQVEFLADMGYCVKGVGDGLYLGVGDNSVTPSADPIYHESIGYNSLYNSASSPTSVLSWNNSGTKFGFYGSIITSAPQMYKIMSELSNYRTLCTYDIVLKNNYVDDDSKDGLATITATKTTFNTFTPPTQRPGYTIAGYYAEPQCTKKVVEANRTLITNVDGYTQNGQWIGGNVELYTKWQPLIYNLQSGNFFDWGTCSGGTLTLNGSAIGVKYQLYKDDVKYGEEISGTGEALIWEITESGNYTVQSVDPEMLMNGEAVVQLQDPTIVGDNTVEVGETIELTHPGHRDAAGSWVSSNPEIARVDNNIVIGVAAGTVTITFHGLGNCDATHEVTVVNPEYTMTWKIDKDTHATTTIISGNPILLPEPPADDALGCCADKFIGWTASTAQTISKADVFTTLAEAQDEFPNITEDKTFYAVFATAAQGVGTSIADFSEMGYENGTAVTEPIVLGDGEGHGDATITLAKAPSSKNDAKYYDDGAAVRVYAGGTITISSTYGGATIKSVTFEFSASDPEGDNTISVTSGDGTYSEGTWTGDASTVTFTIGGSTGHRRIASITVTTGVAGSQYTNYVTSCDKMNDPSLGAVQLTYKSGDAIAVNCGTLSSKNSAASITFPNAVNLTCPITVTAPAGFVLATNRQSDTYTQTVVIKPVKTAGENKGKITKTVYVRADAPENSETDYSSNITITGEEITETTVTVKADVTCKTYTFETLTHIGDEHTSNTYYAGQTIEEAPVEPDKDDCSENYTFDGWSTAPVEYGSVAYSKVTFPYTMPAENVTLIPVYRLLEDISKADYHRVTSDLGDDNWAGDYLIAANNDEYFAMGLKGGTSDIECIGGENSAVTTMKQYVVNNTISYSYGDPIHVTMIAVENGYVLQTRDGRYNFIRNTETSGLVDASGKNTAAEYPLTISFDKESHNVSIANLQTTNKAELRYTGSRFGFYDPTKYNPIYLYKKSPLYTTSLICGTIDIQESDIVVTSTKDQSVKVSVPVKLTSPYNDAVAISGANVNSFSVITKENVPVNTEEVVNVELVYSPQAYDQLETETITLTATNGATTSFQITGRSLPEKFAIVAEKDGKYYALPADMPSAGTYAGYEVEVKDNAIVTAPATYVYSLSAVHNTRYADYGTAVRFVGNDNKCLWASKVTDGTNIRNFAEVANATSDQYEWNLSTTDGERYTISSSAVADAERILRLYNQKFGMYTNGVSEFYFLPLMASTEDAKVLSSAFSVSATEKVQFSAGNLQYHTGDKAWRFAPEQYDYVGDDNANIGEPTFEGWIDMFGWSADGKYGVNTSINNDDYQGEFVDWGTLFPDEWYTLSMNEWYYLLNTRTNAANLKQLAKVGDVYGVLLFPDEWVMPYDVTTPSHDEYNRYSYSLEDWQKLEIAGAVFLPAAGRRAENHQYNTNEYIYYWTSTKETQDKVYYLISCNDLGNDQYEYALPQLWYEKGLYGQSVRLARKLMPLQVVEWKENSVVVMYNGDPAQTATVTINNEQKGTATLSEVAKDIAVYELPATGLASSPNQPLEIAIGNAKALMTIPYVATATTTNVVPNNSDLVVLKDATFTATNEQLRNVTVYGGGKLVVGEGATLSTNSLTLRAGGVTAEGNYDYVYPQFVLNGTWSNTSDKINLDYLTTKEQYYTFVTPFAVQTKDIHYPVDIYGNNVAANNTGSFEFQYYDGEARADGETGWTVVPEGDDGANLEAGQGYTFLGMPKKVSVNGGSSTRQTFGIHRIPMTVAASTAMTHETTDQTAPLSVHLCDKNNNSGWNLIGNPYMATITGLTNEDIQVGKLVHTTDANGNWTGGWHWDTSTETTNQRFLVIPSNDGQSYEAVQASNATLPAFKNCFVQISNEYATALSIPRTTPAAQLLAPARRTEEVVKDVEVAIVLEQDEAHTDQMDFLINNIYTEDFERDADFTKMMNATNLNLYGVHPYDNLSFVAIDNNTARGNVAIGYQVPQAGEYILRMSDKPYVMFDKIEALYVTDHEMSPEVTTDIMSEPYRFTVDNAETNHTRFTVSVILKTEEDDGGGDVGTGVDNTTNNNTPCKFIYQDKMYILRNGVIYDAMGKQVQTINK